MFIAAVFLSQLIPLAQADPATPKTHTVNIKDLLFTPSDLSVNIGDRIIWVNKDLIPHTATAKSDVWDSGEITTGNSWQTDLAKAGIINYICAYHPSMTARITVID